MSSYIGKVPTAVPLTSSDITDGIISVAKLTSTLDLSSNTVTLPSGVGGKVLQVKQAIKTDTFSTTSSSFVDITGLSVSITPSSSSNKIFVISDVAMGMSDFYAFNWLFKTLRDSTDIGISTTATAVNASGGNQLYNAGGNYPYQFGNSKYVLDSPSTTSATTYKIQATKNDASGTLYVNRKGADNSTGSVSSITVMEISA